MKTSKVMDRRAPKETGGVVGTKMGQVRFGASGGAVGTKMGARPFGTKADRTGTLMGRKQKGR